MELPNHAYIIIFFIKSFVMNMFIYYSYNKITIITDNRSNNLKLFLAFDLIVNIIYTYLEFNINSALYVIIMYMAIAAFLGTITKNKLGYSLIVTAIAYAICNIALLLSTIISYIPHTLIYKDNYYLSVISVLLFQYLFVYLFFKIKKFRNGFAFLNRKLNKEIIDVIVGFVSICVLLIVAFMGSLYEGYKTVTKDIFVVFILLGITMFVVIQRTLTMHYKHTQLLKTMEYYKNEIKEKDKEIEKLNKEKYNTSKIRHEFYHRQKALEMLVTSKYNTDGVVEGENENILNIINNLTAEYSEECERIKDLDELDKTDIPEIDSMFKYMQNECAKQDITFKLKIISDIHPLINNIISKSRLETLIGDHIKDAINAVNDADIIKKEIFTILGVKDNSYELVIYDTGKDFEIDTLLKLGVEKVTTCENKGGSGIGFITTFETLNETKASLIIKEFPKGDNNYYAKSVTIRFDGKQEYIVCSYRADKIKSLDKQNRIIVEKLKQED